MVADHRESRWSEAKKRGEMVSDGDDGRGEELKSRRESKSNGERGREKQREKRETTTERRNREAEKKRNNVPSSQFVSNSEGGTPGTQGHTNSRTEHQSRRICKLLREGSILVNK